MDQRATHDPPGPAEVAELTIAAGGILAKLDEIARILNQTRPHVAFGSAGVDGIQQNWPIAGQDRYVIQARSAGGTIALAAGPNNAQDIIGPNAGRAGFSIVNKGVNGAFIYLVRAGDVTSGAPTGWISGNGGRWDGKISDELWCGAVSAQGDGGATTLVWAAI